MKQFTVTEITEAIKNLLEGTFRDTVTVRGEITGFSVSPRGHVYFSLKDEKAKIRVAMFKSASVSSRSYTPKNGDSVEVTGELKLYESDGAYQIIARKIEYDSVGLFWQKFEETKRRLESEGLFDEARKKSIPELPERIALITSPTGAAVTDFITTAEKTGGRFVIDIWAVPVQGKEAALPIIKALNTAGSLTKVYDAVVLMRGGGSLEDLAVFSEENVARAVAATEVPCISAVGHERDFSICDFTADLRVATPTAAAVKLSESYAVREKELAVYQDRLASFMENRVNRLNQRMDFLGRRLGASSPAAKIASLKNMLGAREQRAASKMREKLFSVSRKLDTCGTVIRKHHPGIRIERMRNRTDSAVRLLKTFSLDSLKENKQKLELLSARLGGVSPEKALERGYALVSAKNRLVRKAKDVHLEDELEIRFNDGYINTFVTGRKLSEDGNGKNSDNKRRVSKDQKGTGETQNG
ncbi:exodeoxyribonuclease VII large subunit [Geovibrio thiophilus]|uniref:Exodeoxyribonuclease 7 large subunit n=1 Tax=Geovibrio thiophilus TaxID=139438 RepID=A0A410JXI5_9BACT|nr:exodeoxyribonuclease VII large subunit [Geovibrio thiophilus]QAR32892.1 exodeoxyribonuclease VII large subunit [Geovibrio thiophilus]